MNKFQQVDFKNIGEFLDYLPEDERKIVDQLRELVLNSIPSVKEKLVYNVPFYYLNKRICFIWPGAVQWGTSKRSGVNLGFCKAHLLTNPSYLEKGDRKEIYLKTFYSADEINEERIRELLFEAVLIDKELKEFKK